MTTFIVIGYFGTYVKMMTFVVTQIVFLNNKNQVYLSHQMMDDGLNT